MDDPLAGPPLVNLIAGGYVPIAAVVERTWMAVWPYCSPNSSWKEG